MVDVDRAKEQRLRREAHQFFDAADVRRMEFVVLQDVEDPENEQEQVLRASSLDHSYDNIILYIYIFYHSISHPI